MLSGRDDSLVVSGRDGSLVMLSAVETSRQRFLGKLGMTVIRTKTTGMTVIRRSPLFPWLVEQKKSFPPVMLSGRDGSLVMSGRDGSLVMLSAVETSCQRFLGKLGMTVIRKTTFRMTVIRAK